MLCSVSKKGCLAIGFATAAAAHIKAETKENQSALRGEVNELEYDITKSSALLQMGADDAGFKVFGTSHEATEPVLFHDDETSTWFGQQGNGLAISIDKKAWGMPRNAPAQMLALCAQHYVDGKPVVADSASVANHWLDSKFVQDMKCFKNDKGIQYCQSPHGKLCHGFGVRFEESMFSDISGSALRWNISIGMFDQGKFLDPELNAFIISDPANPYRSHLDLTGGRSTSLQFVKELGSGQSASVKLFESTSSVHDCGDRFAVKVYDSSRHEHTEGRDHGGTTVNPFDGLQLQDAEEMDQISQKKRQKNIQKQAEMVKQQALDEVRICQKLKGSQLIVQAFGYSDSVTLDDDSGSVVAAAFEYCDGGDLKKYIETNGVDGKLSEDRSLEIFDQLVDALLFAHGKHVYHRDIKLENIFLTQEGRVKLGDFGEAVEGKDSDCNNMIVGTPVYLAPERAGIHLAKTFRNETYGPKMLSNAEADVWSLAVVFFRMLTGRFPFDSPDLDRFQILLQIAQFDQDCQIATAAQFADIFDLASEDLDISQGTIRILASMLKRHPSDRISLNELQRERREISDLNRFAKDFARIAKIESLKYREPKLWGNEIQITSLFTAARERADEALVNKFDEACKNFQREYDSDEPSKQHFIRNEFRKVQNAYKKLLQGSDGKTVINYAILDALFGESPQATSTFDQFLKSSIVEKSISKDGNFKNDIRKDLKAKGDNSDRDAFVREYMEWSIDQTSHSSKLAQEAFLRWYTRTPSMRSPSGG